MRKRKWVCVLTMAALLSMGATMTAMADWSAKDGKWYYYNDSTGQMVRDDWVSSNNKWYYVDQNGVMQTKQLIDDTYYVNESGVMVTDAWVSLTDRWSHEPGWRYFGSNGRAYTDGWKTIGETKYHFTDSVMDTGWYHSGDAVYYLGSSGAMATGWRKIQDENDDWGQSWYYFGTTGKRETAGEKKIDGSTYIFDQEGRMLTGWVNPSNYTSSGREDLSTKKIDSLVYYKSGGQRASGWQYLTSPDENDEGWYYFKDGRAYSAGNGTTAVGSYGMVKIQGETYCFDAQGIMVTGLIELSDGRKFYFNPSSGAMMTGRVVVNDDEHDNEVFYFTTSGTLGSKGDGYTGVKSGYLYDNGNLICAEEGMKYEKVTVDGHDYVVNENGAVKTTGTVKDSDGVQYKIEKQSDGNYKITVIQ